MVPFRQNVEFVLATDADVVRIARAVETRAEIAAEAVVHARIADVAVGGRLVPFSVGAGRTSAEEIAQQIDAIGVQTRLQLAEINVLFAPLSGPACPGNLIEINKETDQNGQIQVPGGQVHLKLLTSSVQAPPLRPGETGNR